MGLADALLILVRTGAVLAATLLAGAILRGAPALRQAVYRVGLVAAVAVAVASPWLRERPAPIVPVAFSAPVFVSVLRPAATVKAAPAALAPVALPAEPVDLLAFWPALYLAGVGLLALRLAFGYAALARVAQGCREVDRFEGLRVAEGEAVAAPFVAGVRRPTIFLPLDWRVEDDVREAVLRHEAAHVGNGDLRWSLFRRLVGIVLWPQPLVWLLARPMAAAGEAVCDGQVLAAGISGTRYAEGLLGLRPGPTPRLGVGAVGRSGLGRRIEAILQGRRVERPSGPARFAVRVGALALAAGAAFVFARPAPGVAAQDPFAGWIRSPYAMRVRVLDAAGRPVPTGRAWLIVNGDDRNLATPLPFRNGEVAVGIAKADPDSTGTLVVRAEGRALGYARLWPVRSAVTEIRLAAPTALAGRLLLPGGAPAAGVRVRPIMLVAKAESESPAFALVDRIPDLGLVATTAADGSFRLGGLPPSTTVDYDVDDVRFARTLYKERVETKPAATTVVPPRTLRLAARFAGRVTREGRPVAGLRIAAQGNSQLDMEGTGNWGEARTDAAGRFAIERLPAGAYNVIADLPAGGEATAVAHEGVRAVPGKTIPNLDFALVPGAVVEGRVTDEAGKPAQTSVGVYGPAHPQSSAWVQMARSDADGRYRLRVPAGRQYVYLMSTVEVGQKGRTVQVADGTTTTIDFTVPIQSAPKAAPAAPAVAEERSPAEPDDSRSVGPVASFGRGTPFYGPARLKGGATVRLAYVQYDEAASHTLWRPDGAPADPRDVAESLNMKGFGGSHKSRRMFAKLAETGLVRGEVDHVVQVPQPSNWTVYQSYGDDANRTGDLLTFNAPNDLRVTDVRVGIASGPFRTVRTGPPGTDARVASHEPSISLPGSCTVTVAIPPGIEGRNVSVVAYDARGRALELRANETESRRDRLTGKPVRSFGFDGASADDVARIDLLVRDYEWVTFRGVRLQPWSPG